MVGALEVEARAAAGSRGRLPLPVRHAPFYEHYQLGGTDEPDEAETEPRGGEESRRRYEPSHSLFGFIWQVAAATGWSVDRILWSVPYQTLLTMLADAPRYVRKEKASRPEQSPEAEADRVAREMEGFFQTK